MCGRFTLIIPNVVTDSAGVPYDKEGMIGGAIERDFEQVYVTDPDKDTSTTINAALAAGYDLVISPGIYTLDASITGEIQYPCSPPSHSSLSHL